MDVLSESYSGDDVSCPECGDAQISVDEQHGETVCQHCGCVLEDSLVSGEKEWRAFDQAQRQQKRRTGPSRTPRRHDYGLSTKPPEPSDRDGNGNRLSAGTRRKFGRLRMRQRRARTQRNGEVSKKEGLTEIRRIAAALGVPQSVEEVACALFHRAVNESILHGHSTEAMASACLFVGCRQTQSPAVHRIEELRSFSRVDVSRIKASYRRLKQTFDLPIPPLTPTDCLPRICSELSVSASLEQEAREILAELPGTELSGCSPLVVASSALYVAAAGPLGKIKQQEIADAADVSPRSIQTTHPQIESALRQ
jgi:transcription initiation factor TFIIB